VTGFVFGQNLHERVAVSMYSSGCCAAGPYLHFLKPMTSCIKNASSLNTVEILLENKNFHTFPKVTKVISFKQMLISIFTIFMTINAAV
jgi:hypothetical protein